VILIVDLIRSAAVGVLMLHSAVTVSASTTLRCVPAVVAMMPDQRPDQSK